MLNVLAQGTLTEDSQERQGASGKTYVTVRLGVPVEGTESVLVSLIAFDRDAKDSLMQLGKGDAVSVAGQGKLTSWTGRDGVEKYGLGITVSRVMSVYESGMKRREARDTAEQKRAAFVSGRVGAARSPAPLADLQDDLPWQQADVVSAWAR